MQLRSCSTVVETVGLNASLLNPKAGVFSLWLIFLTCFDLGNIQRQVCGSGQLCWLGFVIRLCSDCSHPQKGSVTPLVCQATTSPDREGGESLGALPKHAHMVCQLSGFSFQH